MIYFDNAATTQPYKEVVDTFFEASLNKFYNPSASYLPSFNLFKEIAIIMNRKFRHFTKK